MRLASLPAATQTKTSSYYDIHHNFCVFGGHKSDFDGNSKYSRFNIHAYASVYVSQKERHNKYPSSMFLDFVTSATRPLHSALTVDANEIASATHQTLNASWWCRYGDKCLGILAQVLPPKGYGEQYVPSSPFHPPPFTFRLSFYTLRLSAFPSYGPFLPSTLPPLCLLPSNRGLIYSTASLKSARPRDRSRAAPSVACDSHPPTTPALLSPPRRRTGTRTISASSATLATRTR